MKHDQIRLHETPQQCSSLQLGIDSAIRIHETVVLRASGHPVCLRTSHFSNVVHSLDGQEWTKDCAKKMMQSPAAAALSRAIPMREDIECSLHIGNLPSTLPPDQVGRREQQCAREATGC